jgi:hypothetical protein
MISKPHWTAYAIAYGLMLLGMTQLITFAIKLAM